MLPVAFSSPRFSDLREISFVRSRPFLPAVLVGDPEEDALIISASRLILPAPLAIFFIIFFSSLLTGTQKRLRIACDFLELPLHSETGVDEEP